MQLTAGSLLQGGKYLINHPLETQGFGVTYRGTQTYHGQPVVIKTLHPALHKSRAYSRLRDRFLDLAAIVTRCQHPSIVRVVELFQEGDLPFMVMEYVPGQKLATLVKPGQTMAEMEALHYIRLIGAALTISHRFGLVHGNLMPQNIIRRGGSNVPVLVGYGISPERMLAAVQYAVPGFPHAFNAPEQIGEMGDRVVSADVYGLAANFYYLLTGHPPLPAPDRQDKALADQLPLLALLNPSLQGPIVQGLALDPQQRPKTIDEWLNFLPGSNVVRVAARPEMLPSVEPSHRPLGDLAVSSTAPTQLEAPAAAFAPTLLDPPPTHPQTSLPPVIDPTQLQLPETTQLLETAQLSETAQAPSVQSAMMQAAVDPIAPTPIDAGGAATEPRPAFRREPLPTPAPAPLPALPPASARPRFRREPLAPKVPVDSTPAAASTPTEPVVPLVPAAPSRAEQQLEQQLQQRPVRPYNTLPPRNSTAINWKKMLLVTASFAATIGVSFGLALRFSAARSPQGASIFHAEQAFPPRSWVGTLAPTDKGDAPIEESLANPPADKNQLNAAKPNAAKSNAAKPDAAKPDAAKLNSNPSDSPKSAAPGPIDATKKADFDATAMDSPFSKEPMIESSPRTLPPRRSQPAPTPTIAN